METLINVDDELKSLKDISGGEAIYKLQKTFHQYQRF